MVAEQFLARHDLADVVGQEGPVLDRRRMKTPRLASFVSRTVMYGVQSPGTSAAKTVARRLRGAATACATRGRRGGAWRESFRCTEQDKQQPAVLPLMQFQCRSDGVLGSSGKS